MAKPHSQYTPLQRAGAICALLLLAVCLILTIRAAVLGDSAALMALLLCDMAIPLFFYLMSWVYGLIHKKEPQEPEEPSEDPKA